MADDSLEHRLGRPSDLSFQFCQLPLDSAARVPLHSTDSIWPTQTLLSCTNLWLVLFLTQYPRLPLTLRYHFELLVCKRAKSLQSCLTLCDPMDCSPPDSSVHRILQARILEWVAKHSSRGSSRPWDRTRVFYVSCMGKQVLYHQCHWGSPQIMYISYQCFMHTLMK